MRNVRLARCLIAASAAGIAGGIHPAAAEAASNVASALPTMVISATRGELDIKDSPASVSVLTADDLQKRSALTLDQAINVLPGANFKRNKGFMESEPRIFMRGMPTQARTLVMVDGVPLNNVYNGAVNFDQIDVDNIERIEMVRGPFSSLYGGSAMGGVISVFTKPVNRSFGTVKLGYGDAFEEGSAQKNLFDALVSGGMRLTDALGVSVSYRYRSTDGYPTAFVTRTDAQIPAGLSGAIATRDTLGSPRNVVGDTGFNNFSGDILTIRGDYAFANGDSIVFTASRNESEYGYDRPNTFMRDAEGNPVFLTPESIYLSGIGGIEQTNYAATYRHGWGDVTGALAVGYVEHAPRWFTLPVGATLDGGAGRASENEAHHWVADWNLQIPIGLSHILTAGIYHSQGEHDSQDHTLTDYKDRHSKVDLTHESRGENTSYAVYLQDRFEVTDAVTTYLGLRYDWWKNSNGMSNTVGAPGFPRFYEERTESRLSPKVAVTYKHSPATTFRASYGSAFRAPNLNELFHTTGGGGGARVLSGNPELKPETTVAWEVGVTHQLGGDLYIDGAYFDNRMEDFIYRRVVDDTLSIYENLGEATARGFELGLSGRLFQSMEWYVNHAYTESKIVSNPAFPDTEGKYLPSIPKRVTNLGASWKRGAFSLSGAVRSISDIYARDDNADTVKGVYGATDPYTLAEVKVGYQFTRNVSASLSVDNLFDKEHYYFFLSPGRSWFAQVAWTM